MDPDSVSSRSSSMSVFLIILKSFSKRKIPLILFYFYLRIKEGLQDEDPVYILGEVWKGMQKVG